MFLPRFDQNPPVGSRRRERRIGGEGERPLLLRSISTFPTEPRFVVFATIPISIHFERRLAHSPIDCVGGSLRDVRSNGSLYSALDGLGRWIRRIRDDDDDEGDDCDEREEGSTSPDEIERSEEDVAEEGKRSSGCSSILRLRRPAIGVERSSGRVGVRERRTASCAGKHGWPNSWRSDSGGRWVEVFGP